MKLFRSLALASVFASSVVVASAQFAGTVVSYVPGTGVSATFTNDATVALGAPSQINPFFENTDPFNPPYGTNQIVSIGAGGSLTVRFTTPVTNSPGNHFGIDFTVFGNDGFVVTNDFDLDTFEYVGTPATDGSRFSTFDPAGLARVWVSADGTNYFLLNTNKASFPDGLYPPFGAGIRDPVNPALTDNDFAGLTLDGITNAYHGSAGGAGYDISWAQNTNGAPVVLNAISYVRIEIVSGKAEIDALAATRPLITAQPISRSVTNSGTNITFSVTASSTTTISYQWLLNGVAVEGETNSTLTVSNAFVTANAGNYSVVVTDDAGSVTSTTASLNKPVPMGTYSGLFYETNSVKHGSSGFFSFTVAKTRLFNGKLLIEGGNYKLSGQFASNHQASVVISRPGGNLTVNLQLLTATNADQVTGTVGNGIWTAPLLGDRSVFNLTNNPTPQAGQYTFTLFTDSNGDDAPSNGSLGIANVKTNGVITLSGPLADAAGMVQSTYISKAGQWPLYVPLYKGAGSLLGWVTFTNQPTLKLTGDVSWIKTNAFGLYYPHGFTNTLTLYGGSRKR